MDKTTIKRRVSISPEQINNKKETIINKLNSELTGKCTEQYGFVLGVSGFKFKSRGQIENNGFISYDVSVDILRVIPTKKTKYTGNIELVTQHGFLVKIIIDSETIDGFVVFIPNTALDKFKFVVEKNNKEPTFSAKINGKEVVYKKNSNIDVTLSRVTFENGSFSCVGSV